MATPHVLALIGAHLVMSQENESMSSASDMAERCFCFVFIIDSFQIKENTCSHFFTFFFFLKKENNKCFLPEKSTVVP